VDAALGVFRPPGWTGLLLALAGAGAAVVLLAVAWRPAPADTAPDGSTPADPAPADPAPR
jgi:hypothetical protein